jgi:GntR family transcriptional repressor for pyruvate dehydrogenase complex
VAKDVGPSSVLPAPVNRTGQLMELLTGEIRNKKYASGERLPTEQAMVARFGVSRTVVREAIASLRAQGLVVARQGVGVFVAENATARPFSIGSEGLRSLTDMLDVMQLRLAVEVEAAGLAAANSDPAAMERLAQALDRIDKAIDAGQVAIEEDFGFHVAISAGTGNPQFERFMGFLGTVIIPRQTLHIGTDNPNARLQYLRRIQREHRAIFAAIRDGNEHAARRAARLHLEHARDRYIRLADGKG